MPQPLDRAPFRMCELLAFEAGTSELVSGVCSTSYSKRVVGMGLISLQRLPMADW